jgi:predicted nucleic acid-binding protein
VSQFIFLDSGPLGLITHPRQTDEVAAITEWLALMLKQGKRVLVPAIIYYELKRELLRAQKPFSVGRLDVFCRAANRYIPLTDEALRLSAELWAKARQEGRPTADSRELDIDVILAAQALSFGAPAGDVVIATTNAKHLEQFVTAKHWTEILP